MCHSIIVGKTQELSVGFGMQIKRFLDGSGPSTREVSANPEDKTGNGDRSLLI